MSELFTNLASTTLSGDHAAAATSIVVADGSVFPSPTGSDFFRIVAFKKSTGGIEIMQCTARASNTLTVTRAQESTSALDLLDGDIIELRPTAGFFGNLAQKADIQDWGSKYAAATGTDTIAATFSPAISAAQDGMTLAIVPANTVTGAATFNPGSGAAAVKKNAGVDDVAAGDIVAGQLTLLGYYNSLWHLLAPAPPNTNLLAPSGTKMLFQQTAAPTGWTKVTGAGNNNALRIVTGSAGTGGAVDFTTAFAAGRASDGHALTISEMPAHTHNFTRLLTNVQGNNGGSSFPITNGTDTTASTGGGAAHTHGLPSFAVKYTDVIIATKD